MFAGRTPTTTEKEIFNEFISDTENLIQQGRSTKCLAENTFASFYCYYGRNQGNQYGINDFFNTSLLILLRQEGGISSKKLADFVHEFIEIIKREKPMENNPLETFYREAVVFIYKQGVSAQFLSYFIKAFSNLIESRRKEQAFSSNDKPVVLNQINHHNNAKQSHHINVIKPYVPHLYFHGQNINSNQSPHPDPANINTNNQQAVNIYTIKHRR